MKSAWSPKQVLEEIQNTFGKPSEILHAAVRDGDLDRLRLLLRKEDIQSLLRHTNYAWGTPLHVAVSCIDVQALRLLLSAGADALLQWDQDDSDVTPMQLAAGRGNEPILSALWDAAMHRTHVNGPGSCLISAGAHGQADIVRWLFAAWDGWAADVTSRALATAVQQWHTQVVEVLLQHVNYDQAFRYDMLEKACGLKPMPDRRGMPEYEQVNRDNQCLLVCRLINTGLNANRRARVSARLLTHVAAGNVALGDALRGLLESGASIILVLDSDTGPPKTGLSA